MDVPYQAQLVIYQFVPTAAHVAGGETGQDEGWGLSFSEYPTVSGDNPEKVANFSFVVVIILFFI